MSLINNKQASKLFIAGKTNLGDWLNDADIEDPINLYHDDCAGENALHIIWPLRIIQPNGACTVVMRFRPLNNDYPTAHLWTQAGIDDEAADYYQVINTRIQNHYAHLRHLPGTYDLDSLGDEELNACIATERNEFQIPFDDWSTMVISWGRTGSDPNKISTQVYINGQCVLKQAGSLRFLHLTRAEIKKFFNLEAICFWERDIILAGIALTHYTEIKGCFSPEKLAELSKENGSEVDGSVDISQAEPLATYRSAPGICMRGIDCANSGKDTIYLEATKANRINYWHADAKAAPNQSALFGFENNKKLLWNFEIAKAGDYYLNLCYEMLMPSSNVHPALTVHVDNELIVADLPFPASTGSGPLRPENVPYKALAFPFAVFLEPGAHKLGLTFKDNNFTALSEILLSPIKLCTGIPPEIELSNYIRPPFMEIIELEEKENGSHYHLRFKNSTNFNVDGKLRIDESSDPEKTIFLSRNTISLQNANDSVDVWVSFPAILGNLNTRLIFTEEKTANSMVYYLRHRRPYHLPHGQSIIKDKLLTSVLWDIPVDSNEQIKLVDAIKKDSRIRPWLSMDLTALAQQPPSLKSGHGCVELSLMTKLLFLTRDEDLTERIKTILLAHTRIVITSICEGEECEERIDTRGKYSGSRRGSIFGELFDCDIFALSLLVEMNAISDKELLYIEGNLIWTAYEYSKRFHGMLMSRGQAHYVTSYMIYAQLTGDETMLKEVEKAMVRYGSRQMHQDGTHNEKISSYGASFFEAIKMAAVNKAFGRDAFLENCAKNVRNSAEAYIGGCFSNGALLRQGDGGLQRGFQIYFANLPILKMLTELFPDMKEQNESLAEYCKILYERVMAKHNHQAPGSWPKLPGELLRKSDLFPDGGWAILRPGDISDRMELSLDWSATGDHGHPDTLNMNIFAFDEVLSDDIGYGFGLSGDHFHLNRTFGYAMRTVSHNTVVADMQCQLPSSKANLLLFDSQKELSVVWSDSGNAYGEDIKGDRCLILLGDIAIDLFKMSSDKIRQYDYMLHCVGGISCSLDMNHAEAFCPPAGKLEKTAIYPGYDHLTELKSGKSNDSFNLSFLIDGYPQALWRQNNAWMNYHLGTLYANILSCDSTEVVTGKAPFPYPDINSDRPFFMLRRQCRETLFVSVYNASEHDTPSIKIARLAVCAGSKRLLDSDALALKIKKGGTEYIIIQKHIPGKITVEGVGATYAKLIIYKSENAKATKCLRAYD